MFAWPLTAVLLATGLTPMSAESLDVAALTRAIASGKTRAPLEWTISVDHDFPIREAAERLLCLTIARTL